MTRVRVSALALTLLSLAIAPALGTDLGDPAPALKIAQWVKGGPVDLAERKDKGPTVVEFWATWCGPCRQTIPHLTELQKKYREKGVVFVGISGEAPTVVKPFVDQMGEKMDYAVAVDDQRATDDAYMKAFGVDGIPHAFIVGTKGEILWHGHPATGLEEVLDHVLAGTYDLEAAKKVIRAQEAVQGYFQRVAQGRDDEETKALGARVVEEGAADAQLMNELAWTILTEPSIQKRDLGLAMKAAEAALAASQGKDAAILDTYARALFDHGKVAEAIEYQTKAVAAAEVPEMKSELEATLKQYEEAAKGAAGDGGKGERK